MNVCNEVVMCNADVLKGLWFSLEIGTEEYVAFVSTEALLIHFQAAGTEKRHLLRAYRKHRQLIDAVAKDRFHNHAPRPVKLDIGDFHVDGFVRGALPRKEAIAAT